jgi:hypothetical protein
MTSIAWALTIANVDILTIYMHTLYTTQYRATARPEAATPPVSSSPARPEAATLTSVPSPACLTCSTLIGGA